MQKIVTQGAAGKDAAQAKGGKKNGEIASQPLLVHTVFGVSIASPSSLVYVKLGNEYVKKSLDEVVKGEEILFGKEGIPDITIEQVGAALAKSERYAGTQPILFKRLEGGSYTTAFKHALFSGMASEAAWPEIISNDTVLKSQFARVANISISYAQQVAAAVRIRETLVDAGAPAVSEEHIRHGWLGGKTIAPSNKEKVLPALVPLAPKISELLSPAFSEAYKLYVVIRQTVMRSVSLILHGKAAGLPSEEGNGAPEEQGVSVKPEIRMVMEHFATDISREYAAGRVLKIEALNPKPDSQNPRENGQFFKGIVTHEVADPQIKVKTLPRLLRERSVLLPMVYRLLHDFIKTEEEMEEYLLGVPGDSHHPAKSLLNLLVNQRTGGMQFLHAKQTKKLARLRKAGITNLEQFFNTDMRRYEPQSTEIDRKLWWAADLFHKRLYGGALDSLYGVPAGTMGKFFDHWFNLESALPFDYEYLAELRDIITDKNSEALRIGRAIRTKEEREEIRKIEAKYRKWGVHGNSSQAVEEVNTAALQLVGRGEPVYDGILTPEQVLAKSGIDIRKLITDGVLVDDAVALGVLREMGFGHLEFFYPTAYELAKPPNIPRKDASGSDPLRRFLGK